MLDSKRKEMNISRESGAEKKSVSDIGGQQLG